VVGPSSPPSGCIIPSSVEGNGFSQSWDWLVGFDHNGEIVVWEEDVDFWERLPLDWGVGWCFWGGGIGNSGCHGRRISVR